jgi:PKD repeat protein
LFRDASTDEQLLAPLVGANVILDATPSRDVDGTIARYRWDLDGDGDVDVESSDPTVSTSYADVGEQSITLWVTDDYGNVAETTATFEVVAGITVVRSIVTHLPGDEMIAGAVVEVTLTISVNASLHGMIVRETLPVPGAGWAFADVSSIPEPLSRPAVKLTSTSAEWAFAEDIVAGSSNSQRVIRYTLTVPSAVPSADRTLVALQGSVSSSSPRLSQATLGEDRITLLKYLSVPVAISCWNVATSAVDLMLGDAGIITSAQLNYAISLWESGSKVPATNDVIDAETLRELIAYAETRSSVYDPLP